MICSPNFDQTSKLPVPAVPAVAERYVAHRLEKQSSKIQSAAASTGHAEHRAFCRVREGKKSDLSGARCLRAATRKTGVQLGKGSLRRNRQARRGRPAGREGNRALRGHAQGLLSRSGRVVMFLGKGAMLCSWDEGGLLGELLRWNLFNYVLDGDVMHCVVVLHL